MNLKLLKDYKFMKIIVNKYKNENNLKKIDNEEF